MVTTRTQAWLDQEDARVAESIARFGWHIAYIHGDSTATATGRHGHVPFAYTIGLFGMGHPELLIFGVPPETAAGVLNDLGERVRSDSVLRPGELLTFTGWPHHVIPEQVPFPGLIALGAFRYYREPEPDGIEMLQLSYNDRFGYFPWDPRYCAPDMQPRPGTFCALS